MPRHKYKKQTVGEDSLYDDFETSKLINLIMKDGKKSVAKTIVYQVFEDLKKQGKDPLRVLHAAIENVAPKHEVKPRRLGGASYLVPIEVRRERRLFLALNWIIKAARSKPNKEFKSFYKKLYLELLQASKGEGEAVSKREQTEKLAAANRAFAHLKW